MITHDFFSFIINLIDYSLYCSAQPQHWIGCTKFWMYFYFSLSFLMFIIFVFTAYKIYKDNRDYKAYLKRKADREKVAPPEVMAEHVWRSEFDS